jgi:hypothetical protein
MHQQPLVAHGVFLHPLACMSFADSRNAESVDLACSLSRKNSPRHVGRIVSIISGLQLLVGSNF